MLLTESRADRVVLHNITWQQFENLIVDLGESRAARIAYDDGMLEIMTPLPEHEYYKEIIGDIIKDTAEVLEIDYECYGSTTWKREFKKAGLESDNCFYFQNEALIRGKLKFDLNQDPPPDLALEIDVTSKSLDRFPIYARLGVPEIWSYDSGEIKIYQLQGEEYVEREASLVFPNLNIREIPSLIEKYRMAGRRVFRQAIREWVRNQES
ncbi:Uma2 family endonuclease [Aetokthonos hydrillicola Thurmond2011]|jgi:Uma2 family endonuclease|uniref:Uma2 family endonuclease n=1 Tax=Aetokthonos hydrillicola Thurmond2011 TaxID=2712845 RepID=A0AAP5IBS4_9CYAN|nr:Uma2 family endonuclease [Aetokthonos hydrillicola]MBO3461440.1 Uma2 family endonuclease [Aetokthonos hydrillicola CCALA 1050]MBW4588782.1 Uma2 family endonuclease [Aetokthonos hydrillicola CCALA 1050]MDR9897354.1 Uma2 family endonuclease [Aetokthonos hydrillicola Thurmond2011]